MTPKATRDFPSTRLLPWASLLLLDKATFFFSACLRIRRTSFTRLRVLGTVFETVRFKGFGSNPPPSHRRLLESVLSSTPPPHVACCGTVRVLYSWSKQSEGQSSARVASLDPFLRQIILNGHVTLITRLHLLLCQPVTPLTPAAGGESEAWGAYVVRSRRMELPRGGAGFKSRGP